MSLVVRRRGSLLWPAIATVLALAVLVGLGTWQLQRLAWKEGLLREIAERTTVEPVAPPPEADWSSLRREDVEYRRVRLEGTFRNADEVLVFTDLPSPRGPLGGAGFWVLTPLLRPDGSTVIVNRGFVPRAKADRAARRAGEIDGPVEVDGILRWSEDRNVFTPADDPASGQWFTRDPAAIAAARSLARVAPFYVDAHRSAPGGLPQGGETRLVLPNRHLEYALTWYGLALALLAVVGVLAWRRRSGG